MAKIKIPPHTDVLQITLSPSAVRLLIRALGGLIITPGLDDCDKKIARAWRVYLEKRLEGRP